MPPARSIPDAGLKTGDIAGDDIVIRKDMTVEDREMTEQNRRQALDSLIPVYEFNEQKIAGSQMLLNEWFRFFKEIRKEFLLKKLNLDGIRSRISENFGLDLRAADRHHPDPLQHLRQDRPEPPAAGNEELGRKGHPAFQDRHPQGQRRHDHRVQ